MILKMHAIIRLVHIIHEVHNYNTGNAHYYTGCARDSRGRSPYNT